LQSTQHSSVKYFLPRCNGIAQESHVSLKDWFRGEIPSIKLTSAGHGKAEAQRMEKGIETS
jgi:hypothetical protein